MIGMNAKKFMNSSTTVEKKQIRTHDVSRGTDKVESKNIWYAISIM